MDTPPMRMRSSDSFTCVREVRGSHQVESVEVGTDAADDDVAAQEGSLLHLVEELPVLLELLHELCVRREDETHRRSGSGRCPSR